MQKANNYQLLIAVKSRLDALFNSHQEIFDKEIICELLVASMQLNEVILRLKIGKKIDE